MLFVIIWFSLVGAAYWLEHNSVKNGKPLFGVVEMCWYVPLALGTTLMTLGIISGFVSSPEVGMKFINSHPKASLLSLTCPYWLYKSLQGFKELRENLREIKERSQEDE
jgi:hypothetical protein